jgi:hypothetical protein
MVRFVKDPSIPGPLPPQKHVASLLVPASDLVTITAADIRMSPEDLSSRLVASGDEATTDGDAGGFGTDAAISKGRGAQVGRDLQRWVPDAADAALHGLEEGHNKNNKYSRGSNNTSWDQFALNEKQFGVKTDYREEFYTTELDPSKSKISVAEANRIASEIEKGGHSTITGNIHLLEERGMEVEDYDEEARYGAVIREEPATKAAPLQQQQQQQKGAGSPPPPPPPPSGSRAPAGAWGRGRPGGAAATTTTTSAPIPIDSRKDINKLRAHMTSGPTKKVSPYGTPKGGGLSSSPLVNDAAQMEALNLNPGTSKIDEAVRRDFEQFKLREKNNNNINNSSGTTTNSNNTEELKQFSADIESKLPKSAASAAADAPSSSSKDRPSSSGNDADAAAKKPSTSLNPFAKEFSFNINAKEFKPVFNSSSSSTTTTTTTAPSSGNIAVVAAVGRSPSSSAYYNNNNGPMNGGGNNNYRPQSQPGGRGGGYGGYNNYNNNGGRGGRGGAGIRPPPPGGLDPHQHQYMAAGGRPPPAGMQGMGPGGGGWPAMMQYHHPPGGPGMMLPGPPPPPGAGGGGYGYMPRPTGMPYHPMPYGMPVGGGGGVSPMNSPPMMPMAMPAGMMMPGGGGGGGQWHPGQHQHQQQQQGPGGDALSSNS